MTLFRPRISPKGQLLWTRVKIKITGRDNSTYANPKKTLTLAHTIHTPQQGTTSSSPLFMTHGLLGSKFNWNSIAKAVVTKSGRKVVTFDARNHGDSPQCEEHDYDIMAQDVVELIKNIQGQDKVCLMGHSMGGRTAMVVALKWPEIIDKLIVVDVSPISIQKEFHSEMKSYFEAMLSFNLGQTTKLSEARKLANDHLSKVAKDEGVRAFLLTNLAESSGKIYWKANLRILYDRFGAIGGEMPNETLSKTFEGPSLFIRGEKSTYIPDSDVPKIKQFFPNARFDTIKGSGHWPHADNPNQFLTSLVSFLNQ